MPTDKSAADVWIHKHDFCWWYKMKMFVVMMTGHLLAYCVLFDVFVIDM
jgi:hypothetical protein